MKVFLKIIVAVLLAYIAFQISLAIDFLWHDKIISQFTFTYNTIFDFIEPALMLSHIPEFVLYFVIGWFGFQRNSKYIWSFIVVSFVLNIYLVTNIFTEHSRLSTKVWVYFYYVLPCLATILGNRIKHQITKTKISSLV